MEEASLPDPLRPNWLWRLTQIVFRPFYILWFGYRIRGLEKIPKSGGALFLINHQSFLDPILAQVRMSRPVGWLARDSLFRVPPLGWYLRNTYVIPIKRKSAGASSIRTAIEYLQSGFILGMFPEGTRTHDGSVGEFKPGFAMLVRRGNVPVYPIGIAGAYEAFPRGSWLIRPKRIRVVIGDPLTVEEISQYSTRAQEAQLVALVRERVIQCQKEAEEWKNRD